MTQEETFNTFAKDRMVEFDLDKFKKSHPSLFGAIMASMHAFAAQSQCGRWLKDKPVFERECVFIAASMAKYWCYTLFQMVWVDGFNDKGESSRYLALCDNDGEEWGDYEELKADKYFVIPGNDESTPCIFEKYREALLKLQEKLTIGIYDQVEVAELKLIIDEALKQQQ